MTPPPAHISTREEALLLAADPAWLPHAFDRACGTLEFVHVSRQWLHDLPFLDDRYLGESAERRTIELADLPTPAATTKGSCHFIFHSAFCCSTLLARAMQVEGKATSLREPKALASLLKGVVSEAAVDEVRRPLAAVLALLRRPFAPGEAVIVKPQSAANAFLDLILDETPDSRALFLHAPLSGFLLSVVRQGVAGRVWARRLAARLACRPELNAGLGEKERASQTDLQVAALAWLDQQARFARLVREQPADRIATLDSDTLLADPAMSLGALSGHFGIGLDPAAIAAIVDGPIFARDSKRAEQGFNADDQRRQRAVDRLAYGSEIDAVVEWAEGLAADIGVPMRLGAPLLP